MMKKMRILVLVLLSFIGFSLQAQVRDTIDLEGYWKFQKDQKDVGISEKWYNKTLEDEIELPGSMRVRGKGNPVTLETQWTGSIYDSSFYFNPRYKKYRQPGNVKFPFWLTPEKQYKGAAWYQKEVTIPQDWKGKHISIFLERAHIETIVWIDSVRVGMRNSLVAPHQYELNSLLSPGRHRITVLVDNRIKDINVGPDSHSVTDHTQGNWNGMIGKLKLTATAPVYISGVQVYPDLTAKEVNLKIALASIQGDGDKGTLEISGSSFNSEKKDKIGRQVYSYTYEGRADTLHLKIPMGDNFLTWDEFDPALYKLNLKLESERSEKDQYEIQFATREFKTDGKNFTINGRPVFLRGTVDNAVFPLTGYPDMDLNSWLRIFRIIKAHGLNHVRYHSWCPPEAAFKAADLEGVYLHPESPSWANHGTALGVGRPIDKYIYQETGRMARQYGNYASFCMMAYGNEPRGKQVEYLTEFNNYWKKKDPRRLYTGASVGGSWPVIPNNEYMVRGGARDLRWKNSAPQTKVNFRRAIANFDVPFISHEMGQYCVFPNFEEIKKYKGTYKAKNFELFQEDLKDHHMASQSHDFFMASGKLQALCYKYTIEKALRTPGYSGFQLLSLNDYPGQGTALVGVLDAFWDPKPYINKEDFKEFCNSTVPLAEIPKFVFTTTEVFTAALEVSHYGKQALHKDLLWEIKAEDGQLIKKGSFPNSTLSLGLNTIGSIEADLDSVETPGKFTLSVDIQGTSFHNHWDFWVFPAKTPEIKPDFYTCTSLDEKAREVLRAGGKVFLNAAGKVVKGEEVKQTFLPVFWNTSWFQMRPPHTLGILVNPKHPLFNEFPTSYHSDLQWWSIVNKTQVMNLEGFPASFKPLIQPIDTWFMNRRLAMIFEAKVGKGKLLVSSVDLQDPKKDAAAHQLFYSLQEYMNSENFHPKQEVEINVIEDIFESPSKQQFDNYSKEGPDELKPEQKK